MMALEYVQSFLSIAFRRKRATDAVLGQHTSASQPSLCTAKATQAYLENGTLPEEGAICMVNVPPFSNVTWMDVLG